MCDWCAISFIQVVEEEVPDPWNIEEVACSMGIAGVVAVHPLNGNIKLVVHIPSRNSRSLRIKYWSLDNMHFQTLDLKADSRDGAMPSGTLESPALGSWQIGFRNSCLDDVYLFFVQSMRANATMHTLHCWSLPLIEILIAPHSDKLEIGL